MAGKKIFITGIDTDAGKSYATGWYARQLMDRGLKVITQKFIQTGNVGRSEDIDVHRRLMGTGYLPEDEARLTAPIIFSYPASAQLAAAVDGCEIDLDLMTRAGDQLADRFDVVLIEGAGGMMVPFTDTYFAIDYATEHRLPIVLVTNSRLGSINHTILSLNEIKRRGLELHAVLYNTFYDGKDPLIAADTRGFIRRFLDREFPETEMIDVPIINP